MAFLTQQPRRSGRSQLSRSASALSLSQSTHSNRQGQLSGLLSDRNGQDWSVVFPGRSTADVTNSLQSVKSTSESTSPFVSSPDEREAEQSNVELTLPHDQDGTGRFTRPSSPSYAADDEGEGDEEEGGGGGGGGGEAVTHGTVQGVRHTIGVPIINMPLVLDSGSNNSDLDNDSELDALEITSSILISGSETGRRDSSTSHRRKRLSEWENGAGSKSNLSSSSWAWLNAEGSTASHHGRERSVRGMNVLPVVFTSGSEGEEEDGKPRRSRRLEEDEAAFEDALANAHTAQSAGLIPRVPKRRHRKNGESAKGSKRSNSSAVPASDMQLSRKSGLLRSRRGNLSVSNRSGSRVRYQEKAKAITDADQSIVPEPQGVLKAILRKIFQVDDDEVLQAFLRDEGPLQVEAVQTSTLAIESSAALKASNHHKDDIWTRNERRRQLRRSHAAVEEIEENGQQVKEDEEVREVTRVLFERQPHLSASSSDILAAPHRVRLQSNVGEPTLLEALQASVLSGLATVPSGLSILLAGSRSARLVNYLAGRFVGQIGPTLTDKVRKLIDDAEDDTSIQDEIFGSETRSTTSSTRFRGSSHPAISSQSSSTAASKSVN